MLRLPVKPPIPPMLARAATDLPLDGYLYEPKWDGFRALAYRDGEWSELQSRNLNRFGRYFPELVEAMTRAHSQRFVLDGEIVIVGPNGSDFGALLKRVHPAQSRVDRLRMETPASFVAFDLLAEGDDDLTRVPFAERRKRLERLFEGFEPPLLLTPITGDVEVARRWLERFTGRGVDGVIAKARDLRYEPDRRVMVKVKRERTAECLVGGFRLNGDKVTSLLLGVYDAAGVLRHVGVSSSFTTAVRRDMFEQLRRFAVPLAGHPWEHGFAIERRPMGRLRGAAGVWTPELPLDWIPVRPALVCEVAYNQLDEDRFRHPARFVRWRPDRDPASCRFDQFAAEFPSELLAS
ncbi:MAG TPA: ATP-dependent DNA ligase [Candidatus Dormibacteraeota bacterium]|nr:ATP-dependent DNA ligase [Candidatus Dormibacteraeota bacterium]